jgi:hypothetical protein
MSYLTSYEGSFEYYKLPVIYMKSLEATYAAILTILGEDE